MCLTKDNFLTSFICEIWTIISLILSQNKINKDDFILVASVLACCAKRLTSFCRALTLRNSVLNIVNRTGSSQ